MAFRKGFTLMEIVVVMVIIGVIVAVALPNYFNYIAQSKVQAVENNLRAMAAAQQKYYEDHSNAYCSVCINFGSINRNLSLSLSDETVNDGFNYTCNASGTCTAISSPPNLNETVSIDANGKLTCSGTLSPCP